MKKILLLVGIVISFAMVSNAQYITAEDDASNYTTTTWTNNSNEGFGFGAWNMWNDGNAGTFLGSSHAGLIDTDEKAFGMWGNPGYANATRLVHEPLNPGQSFSMELSVHWRDGNRGIDVLNSDSETIYNFNISNAGYGNTGWDWAENSAIRLTITQTGANSFTVSAFRLNDDATWTSTSQTGVVAGFKAYVGETGGDSERNFYINNLKVETSDPSAVSENADVIINGDVELGPTETLTVNDLTIDGSNTLTLKSTATGTASLITNGTVSGDITVERYLTPYYDDTDGKYHFISSPVSAQKIQDEMDGGEVSVENFVTDPPTATTDFYKFDETTNEWINSKDDVGNWNSGIGATFGVGTGYLVAYKTDAVTKNFTGALNNDASYEITCTHTADGAEGWNLIGNPYPAAIDWDAVTLGDGMDNALYYYDSDKSKYRYYIHLAGESGALSSGSQYIPAMQGFMVHAKSSGTKTVTIEKADLTHSDQGFYKSGNASNSVDGSMKIEILTGDLSDETFIHFQSDATLEFDGNYDAYKLFGFNAEVPNIYTVNDQGTKFAINGLPASRENELSIPLYLKPGVDGLFSLKPIINDLNTAITLEDLVTNNFVDLKSVEAYEFVASADDNPNRFILHFGTLTGIEDQITTPKAFAYINGNNLHIRNMEGGYTLRLNDISGRNIMQQQINGNAEIALPSGLNAGVYLLEITSGSNRTVQKVVIN